MQQERVEKHQLYRELVQARQNFVKQTGVAYSSNACPEPEIFLGEDPALDTFMLNAVEEASVRLGQGLGVAKSFEEELDSIQQGSKSVLVKRPTHHESEKRLQKRKLVGEKLSFHAVRLLKAWLFDHFDHPYPRAEEIYDLVASTGLTQKQVMQWFTNARRRIVVPLRKKIEAGETTREEARREHCS